MQCQQEQRIVNPRLQPLQRRSRVELFLTAGALALIALRFARRGELYEQVLLILAGGTVAFLCLVRHPVLILG